jgi:hypothetical protein
MLFKCGSILIGHHRVFFFADQLYSCCTDRQKRLLNININDIRQRTS